MSKRFWNRMAARYDRQVSRKYAKTYGDTIELSRKHLDDDYSVLDFACGTGITTIGLAGCVKSIVAIDTSEKMVEVAKTKTAENGITNVEYSVADIFDSRFDNRRYDALLAYNVLYLINDIDRVLDRINRLLSPDGVFISTTDCLGEKFTIAALLMSFLSKLGIVPFMRKLKIAELEHFITRNGFRIVETRNLYRNPPNCFIAAKKV
ncbi:MAG: class I SAM-dependent methyltransferase [Spirochaetes bacterium]|nr:class I SAM-dependent methyltransferase [Spirochaetota bacterium]